MLLFVALSAVMALMFARLPSSFLPGEDQGVAIAMVETPIGATQERTMESRYALEDHFLTNEPDTVESVFALAGFSFAGAGQHAGRAFVNLMDWSEPRGRARGAYARA